MNLKHLLCTAFSAITLAVSADTPKYIFYFIADGMGPGIVMAANTYLRTVKDKPDGLIMTQFPVASVCQTYSLTSPVTDSAAAGTALACGVKTNNGMIGMDSDSVPVQSIAKILQKHGYGIGIVTTCTPNDATPGPFYAAATNRGEFKEIAHQAATSGFNFIAGSHWRGSFDRKKQEYVDDLPQVMEANGVRTYTDTRSFPVKTDKTVVLLGNLHGNTTGYAIDHPQNTIMLPEMTQACLDQLMTNSPDKFFMMVEGGNIDYAAHPNDGCTQLFQVLNFDEALSIAYEFYKKHPHETLIVVTSDHETGGISLGCKHTRYNAYMQYVDHQKMSKDAFMAWSKDMLKSSETYTWDQMKAMLEENFGFWTVLPVNEEQTATLKAKFEDTFTHHTGTDQKTLYNTFNDFTVEVFKVINDICGFGWTTLSHTGGLVNVFAIGDDAYRFHGFNDNTDLPRHMLEAAVPGARLN